MRYLNNACLLLRYGGLGNRLRAVASALTVAREVDARVVIVWVEKEHGFRGAWGDLFAAPRIPLGCFPGDALDEARAACKVHRINHYSEWEGVKDKFERLGDSEVLCMQSMMFLTYKQRGMAWFYSLLRPVARVAGAIAAFQQRVGWDAWGQWVGVHIRRTDLKLKCRDADKCADGVKAQDVLPLSSYTAILQQVVHMAARSGDKPRFYLATDDAATERFMREELLRVANASEGEFSGSMGW